MIRWLFYVHIVNLFCTLVSEGLSLYGRYLDKELRQTEEIQFNEREDKWLVQKSVVLSDFESPGKIKKESDKIVNDDDFKKPEDKAKRIDQIRTK